MPWNPVQLLEDLGTATGRVSDSFDPQVRRRLRDQETTRRAAEEAERRQERSTQRTLALIRGMSTPTSEQAQQVLGNQLSLLQGQTASTIALNNNQAGNTIQTTRATADAKVGLIGAEADARIKESDAKVAALRRMVGDSFANEQTTNDKFLGGVPLAQRFSDDSRAMQVANQQFALDAMERLAPKPTFASRLVDSLPAALIAGALAFA